MAITDYGAVFEPVAPSPVEMFLGFQQLGAQKAALKAKKELSAAEKQKQADEAFQKAMKPLEDMKVNTGYTDPNPDAMVNSMVKDTTTEAQKMYAAGKPDAEVRAYLSGKMRDISSMHNWFVNSRKSLEDQLATIKPADGIDVNRLRDLATLDMLYVDDGNGGKRLRKPSEIEDVNGLLPKVMSRHADKLIVNNKAGLYNMPEDGVFSEDMKLLRMGDGRLKYGKASASYNKLYQDVVKTGDYDVKIVTRAEPIVMNGEPVLGKDGQPVMGLPQEAYLDFISNPGRMIEVEKEVLSRMRDERAKVKADAMKQAGEQMDRLYGMSLSKMPSGRRLKLQREIANNIESDMQQPNEEVIRQQVAYDLADKYIAKKGVKRDEIRDPSVRNTTVVNVQAKEPVPYQDVYQQISDIADQNNGYVPFVNMPSETQAYILKMANNVARKNPKNDKDQFTQADVFISKDKDGNLYLYNNATKKVISPITREFINSAFNNSVQQKKEILKDQKKPEPAPKKETKSKWDKYAD